MLMARTGNPPLPPQAPQSGISFWGMLSWNIVSLSLKSWLMKVVTEDMWDRFSDAGPPALTVMKVSHSLVPFKTQ